MEIHQQRPLGLKMKLLFSILIGIFSYNSFANEEIHANTDYSKIQKQHTTRILQLKTTNEELLKTHCKYESDIAEKPPIKKIALTLDDGPIPGHTEDILAVLKKHHAPATFFIVGQHAKAHPRLLDLILSDNNHLIGNHSWDHPNFHELNVPDQSLEITKTESLLQEKSDKLFRYPFGNSSCEANQIVKSHNYRIVGWHVDSCDWAFSQNGEMNIADRALCGVTPENIDDYVGHVVSQIKKRDGGIVLFHETHRYSIMKLDELLTKLEQEGYQFASILDKEFAPSLK